MPAPTWRAQARILDPPLLPVREGPSQPMRRTVSAWLLQARKSARHPDLMAVLPVHSLRQFLAKARHPAGCATDCRSARPAGTFLWFRLLRRLRLEFRRFCRLACGHPGVTARRQSSRSTYMSRALGHRCSGRPRCASLSLHQGCRWQARGLKLANWQRPRPRPDAASRRLLVQC